VRAAWDEFYTDYDIMICPVSPVPAIVHDHHPDVAARRIHVNGGMRPYWDQIGWTSLATAGALPAASAPAGFTPGGLPVGVQIIGPHLHDRTVCDVAKRVSGVLGGYRPPPLSDQHTSKGLATARP
jgi:amidase